MKSNAFYVSSFSSVGKNLNPVGKCKFASAFLLPHASKESRSFDMLLSFSMFIPDLVSDKDISLYLVVQAILTKITYS